MTNIHEAKEKCYTSPWPQFIYKMPIISLRKIKKSDKIFFAKWWRDQELLKLTSGYLGVISDEEVDKYFKNILKSQSDFHYVIALDKVVIGHISLCKREKDKYETQIIIGEKDYRGKGYGSKAIMLLINKTKKLNISKIYLEVRPDNIHAIKAYKKCGFVEKGISPSGDKNIPEILRMEL